MDLSLMTVNAPPEARLTQDKLTALRSLVEATAPFPASTDPIGEVISSGIDALDQLLPRGGITTGRLTEISGPRSCGKRALGLAFGARALATARRVAWIDSHGSFYPLPSCELSTLLDQLLVLRLSDHPPATALKAASMLLAAGRALTLIVIDADLTHRQLSSSQLARLQLAAERSGTAVLFISETAQPTTSLGTFIALQLSVKRLSGWRLHVSITKSKQGKVAHHTGVEIDAPHGMRLDTTV